MNVAGSSVEVSDDEERNDPALTHNPDVDVEDVLASFREKWQNELRVSAKPTKVDAVKSSKETLDDFEQQARMWYFNGEELERGGKLYEAIQCYKRAVQLVPDIEFKLTDKSISNIIQNETVDDDIEYVHFDEIHNNHSDDEDEPIKEGTLLATIQRRLNKVQWFCVPEYEQRTTHVSSLPMEILLYVFKWVVSSELDLRSLELCSMVSRGFYLCARDDEIWKLACIRAWGKGCINLPSMYGSWREMYLDRPRLHFNGCYISKTTYIRHGENSFQDQFYRPWHIVAYYRYLRFFPDGQVLMLTTPDEPTQCVGLLKTRTAKLQSILMGHYLLKDDKVIIVVQQQEVNLHTNMYKRGRRRNDLLYESGEQTFHLELQIQSYNKRKHVQLVWLLYSVLTRHKNGTETQSSFDIVSNRFPPLWFSRVKSYTQESYCPLQ